MPHDANGAERQRCPINRCHLRSTFSHGPTAQSTREKRILHLSLRTCVRGPSNSDSLMACYPPAQPTNRVTESSLPTHFTSDANADPQAQRSARTWR